jgi:Na+/proline symporter
MFGGLGATVWIALSNVPGGLSEIWTAASQAGKLSLPGGAAGERRLGLPASPSSCSRSPCRRSVITMVLGRMASYTSDQVMVQRFQTTRSMEDSRRAFVVNAAGDALWMFGLSFVGLALFAYFAHHPLPQNLRPTRSCRTSCRRCFPRAPSAW